MTPYQEHAYIEPNGMIAAPDGTGGVVVHGLDAVPVLRAEGRGLGAGHGPEPRADRADGHRRRLRRQGGRALRARRAGRAAGHGHRPAGAPHLLARGGHGRHVQAPPRAHPGEAGRDPPRPPDRGRGGLPAGRRRLRDAVAGRALPRHRARLRALPRAEREGGVARGAHAQGPLRRLPRLRRAAGRVRVRGRAGRAGRAAGPGSAGAAAQERAADRRRDHHGPPADRERRLPRGPGAGRGRRPTGSASARSTRGTAERSAAASAWPRRTTAWAWAPWAST